MIVKPFKKIDNNWIQCSPNLIKANRAVHDQIKENKGLKYYTVDKFTRNILKSCLPIDLQPFVRIMWVEMEGPFTIDPHTDSGAMTVINWYITAGNGITRFYNTEDNKNKHNVDSLIEESNFTANDNEIYILNTNQIHDVHMPFKKTRTFVSFGFKNLFFNEVVRHFM